MANIWDVFSRVATNSDDRTSPRGEGDVPQTASPSYQQLIDHIAYLHCEQLNLLAEHSQLKDAHSKLSRDNDLLRALIALEEGESGGDDDGADYYVSLPLAVSRSVN